MNVFYFVARLLYRREFSTHRGRRTRVVGSEYTHTGRARCVDERHPKGRISWLRSLAKLILPPGGSSPAICPAEVIGVSPVLCPLRPASQARAAPIPSHVRNPGCRQAWHRHAAGAGVAGARLAHRHGRRFIGYHDRDVRSYAADVIVLAETLRDYGSNAATPTDLLRRFTSQTLHDIWPEDGAAPALADPLAGQTLEHVSESIRSLHSVDAGRCRS